MCGLVGVAGHINKDERGMFNQLLQVDVIRGPHSTGVAGICSGRSINLVKKTLLPQDLMQLRQYDDVVGNPSIQCLIGHNRWATVGKVDNVSAHPFEFEGMVGAHNGTLQGWRADLKDSTRFEVDSECLLHNIHQYGWDETIKKARGAIALTVYHEDTHSICLYRNNDRPLYFAVNKPGTSLYWASEPWMLREMAQRSGIFLDKIHNLKVEHLVSFKLPDMRHMKLSKPTVRKLEVPAPIKKYNNVTALPGPKSPNGGSSYTKKPRIPHLPSGHKLDFIPIEVRDNGSVHTTYLHGIMSDSPYHLVRAYMTDPAEAKRIIDSGCEYSGDVTCTVDSVDGPYYLLLAKTFKQGAECVGKDGGLSPDDDCVMVPGPKGYMIDEREFEVLTKHGCMMCSCDLFLDDEIVWYTGEPLCEDCGTAVGEKK